MNRFFVINVVLLTYYYFHGDQSIGYSGLFLFIYKWEYPLLNNAFMQSIQNFFSSQIKTLAQRFKPKSMLLKSKLMLKYARKHLQS